MRRKNMWAYRRPVRYDNEEHENKLVYTEARDWGSTKVDATTDLGHSKTKAISFLAAQPPLPYSLPPPYTQALHKRGIYQP